MHDQQERLTRWETVGAWLHVWTPPRDAHVPPIPWRKLAAAALGLVVIAAVGYAILEPRINESKQTAADREAKEFAAFKAREVKRLTADQRLQRGSGPAGSRAGVLRSLEADVLADARARFKPPAKRASCEPYPPGSPEPGKFACIAVTSDIGTEGTGRGELGIPFWAKVDFQTGRYAWCKINPKPGERVAGKSVIVALPKQCNLLTDR